MRNTMIYVEHEWLSATEALDRLINLNIHSHKEFMVKCDFCISTKCSKKYKIEYRRFLKVIKNNNNKVICLFCSRKLKFSGRNNPNTKYKNIDDNYFKNINTIDKAYLLGWIASDGHISERGFVISIHQKDIEILNLFQNLICKNVPIKKFETDTSKMCKYVISSKKISSDLC